MQGRRVLALLREPSPRLDACELTHLLRRPIDFDRARKEHAAYAAALRALGVTTKFLPALPGHADGVFVEDMAVVLPELAILARPGAASRRGELASIAAELAEPGPCQSLVNGQLDGGDVLVIGRILYVGLSRRTDRAAIADLTARVAPHGYTVQSVPVSGALHLKTACTYVPPDILVVNPAWVDRRRMRVPRLVTVDPDEPFAANTLTIGATTLVTSESRRTADKLRAAGATVQTVDIAELQKAEAGLTCLSLLREKP